MPGKTVITLPVVLLINICWANPAALSVAGKNNAGPLPAASVWSRGYELCNFQDENSKVHEFNAARIKAQQEWIDYVNDEKRIIFVPDLEPMVHPLIWCGLNLTLLAGVLAWASSEYEWAEMTRSVKRKYRLPARDNEYTAD